MKKSLSVFFIGIMFFWGILNVNASTLTINDVSAQFEKTNTIKELSKLDLIVTSKVNTPDKTLDIYGNGEKIFSFTYGDDYIEYDNRSMTVTAENYMDGIKTFFWIQGVMESVFELSGNANKIIKEEEAYTKSYDTYGIQLETEDFSFSHQDEDGSSSSISGSAIKYFKISLDTEKISALIDKYGVDADKVDVNKEVIKSLKPTLEVSNITENSVDLFPKVNYKSTDTDYTVTCYIYRSDSENGTYKKISDNAINCLGSIGITDKDLKSNTTYYYKAIVDGGTIYSDPVEVVTKDSKSDVIKSDTSNDTSNDDKSDKNSDNADANNDTKSTNNESTSKNAEKSKVKNPKTGVGIPILAISLLLSGSVVIKHYTKNKDKFKRI